MSLAAAEAGAVDSRCVRLDCVCCLAAQAMGLVIGLGGTAGFLASYDIGQLFHNERFTLLNALCIVVACAISSSLFRTWGKSLSGTAIRRGIIVALLVGWVLGLAKAVQ